MHIPFCSMVRQRRLRWLGHVRRMDDGRIPKDILYAELTSGKRQIGRPQLRFKDVCKNDLRCFGIAPSSWENLAQNRPRWRQNLRRGLFISEVTLTQHHEAKRFRRKQQQQSTVTSTSPGTAFKCDICGRECFSNIGLHSHRRRCNFRGT